MFDAAIFSKFGISLADGVALGIFVAGWAGYAWFSVRHARNAPRLHSGMDDFRREWLARMIVRDNRMVPASVDEGGGHLLDDLRSLPPRIPFKNARGSGGKR